YTKKGSLYKPSTESWKCSRKRVSIMSSGSLVGTLDVFTRRSMTSRTKSKSSWRVTSKPRPAWLKCTIPDGPPRRLHGAGLLCGVDRAVWGHRSGLGELADGDHHRHYDLR